MRRILAIALASSLVACTTVPANAPRTYAAPEYSAALADPLRPETDRTRDAVRKPADLLAFAEVSAGERVGDYIMGGGYFTRVLAAAVGPGGHVYAFQPAEFIGFRAQYGTDQKAVADALANVTAVDGPAGAPAFPPNLDTIVTIQNFHDLYLSQMPPGTAMRAAAALYAALKPGGTLVVVDHSAVAGTGTGAADGLHRVEQAAVVSTLEAAGFRLEAESELFADAGDPRTANVFDAAIRGKTDQFALRFRKPS